jgi:hypothetical protein
MLVALLLTVLVHAGQWQSPPQEILDVLHAPKLPWVFTAPSGEHLLLVDPVTYPPLSEYAAGWHELAGVRVKPVVGTMHGRHGGTAPRLVEVEGGAEIPLELPAEAEVHSVAWTVDGERWRYTWLLDVDEGTAKPWFDLNEKDR